MPSVFEVEHCPEISIWIRFTDLIQWGIVLVDDLVYRGHDSGILNGPAQIARRFATDYIVRFALFC